MPEELRARHTGIQWRRWVGFRNILIHAYHRVDLDLVWEASTQEVERLLHAAQAVLDQEFPTEESP